MIYELVTPSDPITFTATNDAVAYAVALYLGSGKAGCTREDGQKIDCLLLFATADQTTESIRVNLGMEFKDFMEANHDEAVDAFESFAYGSFDDRLQYDDAIAAITDPDKLAEFKAKHEDRKRSSMSRWVKSAWDIAAALRNRKASKSADSVECENDGDEAAAGKKSQASKGE